jgi:hypothetical protein
MKESGSSGSTRIFAAIIIAGIVVGASIFGSVYYYGLRASSTHSTQSNSCGQASSSLPTPPAAFLVQVNYSAIWSAVLLGYTGVGLGGNQTQQFSACYTGNGNGFISVPEWNTTTVKLLSGSAQVDDTLFLTVSKTDASGGNLSVSLDGNTASTISPFGSVHLEVTM